MMNKPILATNIIKYAQAVVDGKIQADSELEMACKRILKLTNDE